MLWCPPACIPLQPGSSSRFSRLHPAMIRQWHSAREYCPCSGRNHPGFIAFRDFIPRKIVVCNHIIEIFPSPSTELRIPQISSFICVFIPELGDLIIRSIRVKTSYFTHNSKLIHNFVLQHIPPSISFILMQTTSDCTLQFAAEEKFVNLANARINCQRTVSIFKCDINYRSI